MYNTICETRKDFDVDYFLDNFISKENEFTKEDCLIYLKNDLLFEIMINDDYQELLRTLYKKLDFSFSDKEWREILIALTSGEIDNDFLLERFLVIAEDDFFNNISNEIKESFLNEFIHAVRLDFCSNLDLDTDKYSLFLEYLSKKNISIESLEILRDFCKLDSDDDLFLDHTEDDILIGLERFENIITKTFEEDSEVEFFLSVAASYGCSKILHKYKDYVTPKMLQNLLYEALSTEHNTKCELETVKYLFKEYGTNSFELTPKILEVIKKLELKKLLVILFKSNTFTSDSDWKSLFENVDFFSKVIEGYCSDKVFKNMPFEFRGLLLELMNHRKEYVTVDLQNCNIFKQFAKRYNYSF